MMGPVENHGGLSPKGWVHHRSLAMPTTSTATYSRPPVAMMARMEDDVFTDRITGNAFRISSPTGEPIEIPVAFDPHTDPEPALSTPEQVKAHYEREGYVVVRNLVPGGLIDAARSAFLEEVKPSRAFFCRHESGRFERHVLTDHGFMKYPIINYQDVSSSAYPRFRARGIELLTHPHIQATLRLLMGESGKLVHTFVSEGNQVTWPHRDSYYIDSAVTGALIGVWIAAEDIHPGAGRLYVYPRSHTTLLKTVDHNPNLHPESKGFKEQFTRDLAESGLQCVSPALRKGDAIVFNSLTIHGSLETVTPERSRAAFAGHYIPESHRFVWLRSKEPRLRERTLHDMRVLFHRDQDILRHRLGTTFQTRFPGPYAFMRQFFNAL